MSDHLPIILKLNRCTVEYAYAAKQSSIAWHKLSNTQIVDMYTNPLSEKLEDLINYITRQPILNNCDMSEVIEVGFAQLVNRMHDAAKILPKSQFRSHCKPYWNNELNDRASENKRAWREWVIEGRPRGNHSAYIYYKHCKQTFRKAQRHAQLKYEIENMSYLTKHQELDARYFWYLVSSKRGKRNNIFPIKNKVGQNITKPDQVREIWVTYFKELYEKGSNNTYDENFRRVVEDRMLNMFIESYSVNEGINVISEELIVEQITKCKLKKAPGDDGITNEHLKYGGKNLVCCMNCLSLFFNMNIFLLCLKQVL